MSIGITALATVALMGTLDLPPTEPSSAFSPAIALAAADAGLITSDGPLIAIRTTVDLGCAVNYLGDSAGEFYADTACATLVAADGVLYGPGDIPAGNAASPRTPWTPVSQESSGAGTDNDPYRTVTVVSGGGMRVTQTDTYVVGEESYGTRVEVFNTTQVASEITVYRAGDCFLQDSDIGYGAVDEEAGSVSCVAGLEPGSRVEQWAPLTPGSRYYQSNYGSVWGAVGSQQPFPNTCDCTTQQDNGAGLSWTVTVAPRSGNSFSHLTAFSPTGATDVADRDGDSFPDTWEEPDGGVDTNGDGTPDLRLSDFGATPDKPDVFVQVGYVSTRTCTLIFSCSTQSPRPSLSALADVQQAFRSHGIRLHIDAGAQSVMNPDTGATWGSRSRGGGSVSGPERLTGLGEDEPASWSMFDGYRNQLKSPERDRIFHFALYVGSINGGYSGEARPNRGDRGAGRDFVLAYHSGGYRDRQHPTRLEEAGTFMHELGHTLGLSHGGSLTEATSDFNWKPNYPSVMNYWWQVSGASKYSNLALLDYSDGTLEPFDEALHSESEGLGPDGEASDISLRYTCPDKRKQWEQIPSVYDVDWNCNKRIDSGWQSDDVNGDGTFRTFHDFDDWRNLVFDGAGSLGGAGDPGSVPTSTDTDEGDPQELREAAGPSRAVNFTGPAQMSIEHDTAAPVDLVLQNPRTVERTYSLAATTDGVTIEGLVPSVTLAPGEQRTLRVVVRAGGVRDDAFFEVNAGTADDAGEASSVVTEVFVTAQRVPDQPSVDQGTGPTIATPADVTVEATGPGGAVVTFDEPAASSGTQSLDVACASSGGLSSGALFPVGVTTVACSAEDAQHRRTQSSFTVTVQDTTAPVIARHDDVRTTATSPSGVAVTYDVPLATDAVSGIVPMTCAPATGSVFAVGSTAVTCAASDNAGNRSTSTFSVVVAPPTNRADVSVATTGPASARTGSTVTYTLRVTNNGPGTAAGVTVILGTSGLTNVVASPRAGYGTAWYLLPVCGARWTLPSLATGQSATFTVTGKVSARPGQRVTAVGLGLTTTPDRNFLNNLSMKTTRVVR
jgi:uncharacterized repeat protein (TIGR01451 family)